MNKEYNDLLSLYGLKFKPNLNTGNENRFRNFQHYGEYKGIIGNIRCGNADQRNNSVKSASAKCRESDSEIKSVGIEIQFFFVIRPDGSPMIVNNGRGYQVLTGTEYGELVYWLKVDHTPENQSAMRELFSEFKVNIRGKEYAVVYYENGNYKVDFNLLLFYIGKQVKVLFEKSETGISEIRKISLIDHNANDDLSNLYFRASFEHRKAFVAELEKVTNYYLEKITAQGK